MITKITNNKNSEIKEFSSCGKKLTLKKIIREETKR
jgi:hypothetical protein